MGILEGRVVLVTGGGNGIGKECALVASAAGAKVVVNDLGAGVGGKDDGSAEPAQAVVNEIKKLGGEAVANFGSVTDRPGVASMIEQAMDEFGGLHAVINPAGILRDKMFHKMDDSDWDAVIDVHLNGTYNVARAAINHFRDQEDGSLVLFTSTSGLIGSVGQANYAAAKMGIVGLSRSIAIEGASRNVRSNVIAPTAWTRMISTIPIKDEATAKRVERMKNGMRADQVARFCIALCADSAKDISGQIFSVRGNEIFLMNQPRPIRALGMADEWSIDGILDHCLPALRPDMTKLGTMADVFTWEPI